MDMLLLPVSVVISSIISHVFSNANICNFSLYTHTEKNTKLIQQICGLLVALKCNVSLTSCDRNLESSNFLIAYFMSSCLKNSTTVSPQLGCKLIGCLNGKNVTLYVTSSAVLISVCEANITRFTHMIFQILPRTGSRQTRHQYSELRPFCHRATVASTFTSTAIVTTAATVTSWTTTAREFNT